MEPILLNGQILTFDNSKLNINLILNQANNKPIIWKHCKIQTLKDKKEKKFYYIHTPFDGKEYNRRNNYRIYVGNKGEITLGDNTPVQECLVKDISKTGIAVVSDQIENNNKELINKPIRLSFYDQDLNYHFHLVGEVVRITELENKVVLGCRFTKEYDDIDKYLVQKQREELIKRAGNLSAQEIKSHRMQKTVKTVIK